LRRLSLCRPEWSPDIITDSIGWSEALIRAGWIPATIDCRTEVVGAT
jgi:hypothetical protein